MEQLWIINIITVFLLCVIFAGILIPQILLIAYRKNLFDEPDERKIHKSAVPRLGGMAFTLVILFSLILVLGLNLITGYDVVLHSVQENIEALCFSFCSIILLYIIGIADDLIGIRYIAKFFVQIVCGLMLILGGLWLKDLGGLFLLEEVPAWIGYPLTIFAIVFIINAINLIDGIDGLASGLCSVTFITYGIAFINMNEYLYAALAFANLGVLLPFFYYNVFGNPEKQRKIFMGDTGSLTIGISICILSLKIIGCTPADATNAPNLFVVAFSPLIIPCFDVVRVYMVRVRKGNNPFLPDKNHIHHKFLAMGISQRRAMISIISISLLFVILNCIASKYINVNILLIADALIVTLGNILLTRRIKRREKDNMNNK